ncbi:inositol polyphosphate-5-phosphatase A isoform X1 [Drosophila innubila]|uniref:inositol polyphosphate-5-phosphatase A isoform X1 n=1 Tax=Drosophila innubila TaxID=198719 RepID=UPI00148CA0C5|nr:inositol polyphosphate-5-phosphatase A isoform X1 [Drosophila innubila]
METINEVKSDTELMLVTANVGSLFEDPKRLLSIWLEEFIAKVSETKPRFLALHLQEVGGKTYENSMDHVQQFIQCLCETMKSMEYTYVRIYMDEDFKSAEHFTALGNIYFGHKDLCTLRIWNFLKHDWEDKLDDEQIFSGNIEAISTKEKSKFPQHFFPECKWSRKGFMRTRWEINGTVIELVNIHLFHDASNLAACSDFPSVYCKTRRRALIHTIERFHLDDKNGSVPFFLFGDFNFRCDTAGVVKELTADLVAHRVQSMKTENTKIHYRNSTGNNILTVGKKEFSHADHQLKFKEHWLKKFDKELEPLTEILIEYPITFIPSYPFEEDPEMPTDYMSTRCPSWCDRILMTPQVKDITKSNEWKYDIIGESVCMGDHKPIYLTVRLKQNKGTYRSCDCSCTNTQANNNNKLTSTVQCKFCPYSNKLFTEIVKGDRNPHQEKILQDSSSIKTDAKIINTIEYEDTKMKYSFNYPHISINVVDTDNTCVCMCTALSDSKLRDNEYATQATRNICPMCHNIIKSTFSNSISENIIVNRIDMQHLNTCIENKHVDPYTPESNESHSPYPELRSTSTTTSSNSCNPFNAELMQCELCLDNTNCDHKKHLCKQVQNDNFISTKSVKTITEKQSRATVTPVQLKSRLEDLQRISMHKADRDDITVRNDDVDNVEPICSAKTFSNSQNRNQSIFNMCCSIH